MKHVRIDEDKPGLPGREAVYQELLRTGSMSAGIYRLGVGAADPQTPHTEDEIYFVMRGRASITSAGETRAVEPGDLVFVPAREDHRFHDIEAPLDLLVLFAPAEGSRAQGD